ncbi:MAG: hypothetical protein ACYDBY_05270 [Thermoanaerobaculia bacterium]
MTTIAPSKRPMTLCPSCQSIFTGTLPPTCPTCGAALGTSIGANRKQGSLLVPKMPSIRPATRPKLPVEVTLGIEIDRTGSSAAFQAGIALSSEVLLETIAAKVKSLTVYVGTHGDEECGEAPVLHTAGGTREQAMADIRAITFGGGGDAPETHLDGIRNFLETVPWPMDNHRTRGAFVAFLTDDTKPDRTGATATQIGEAIRAKGLLFYAVCQKTKALDELVAAAGGLTIPISNSPDRSELQAAAAQVSASLVASIGAGAGGTLPMTMPGGAR